VSIATSREAAREKRHERLRLTLSGTTERPRLAVYRSLNQIYAQLIDDSVGRTLASASSLETGLRGTSGTKTEHAKVVGRLLAERAPVSLPDPRWGAMAYGVRLTEEYLRAVTR